MRLQADENMAAWPAFVAMLVNRPSIRWYVLLA